MTKYYYLAVNRYSSETPVGFPNTWRVYVYKTRAARDVVFNIHQGLGIRKIKNKKDITRYMYNRPQPFTSERYCIFWYDEDEGQVVVAYPDQWHTPLYT